MFAKSVQQSMATRMKSRMPLSGPSSAALSDWTPRVLKASALRPRSSWQMAPSTLASSALSQTHTNKLYQTHSRH